MKTKKTCRGFAERKTTILCAGYRVKQNRKIILREPSFTTILHNGMYRSVRIRVSNTGG